MIELERKYHFYAAHRNKNAGEKCGRIHGHTYKVIITLQFTHLKNGISMLFQDVDNIAEKIVRKWDHYLIVCKNDPLCEILRNAGEEIYTVDFETSAENLARTLFKQLNDAGLPVVKLQLAETESSNIIITRQ